MPDKAHLNPNGVIPKGLYVCPGRPKGLESGKDMWREAPHTDTSTINMMNKKGGL